MQTPAPEWIARHGGAIRPAPDGHSWAVMLEDKPQYLLTPVPVAGKYGCEVRQTVNGRRLESAGTYASADAALSGGLEDLRKALGW